MSIKHPLAPQPRPGHEFATLGGGCFWCLEAVYEELSGVVDVESGYAGGQMAAPTYEQVCGGRTGHAEVVRIEFDPARIEYREILEVFFVIHDPTQLNRQGPDFGEQYRSGIWYVNAEQKREAETYIKELQASSRYDGRKIITEVEAAKTFWPAEEYHQDYIAKNGAACHVKDPW